MQSLGQDGNMSVAVENAGHGNNKEPLIPASKQEEDVAMEDGDTEMDGRPLLPWAFINCEIDDLVVLVAHMLNKLMEHNDQVVLTPSSLTRFHSRAPPGISVLDYLKRIVKYTNLEKLPLLSLLAYIDITCSNLPSFTLSSLTVHRFVISGITAGSKALCDVFCTNVHYAKVGGIKVGELNALEREFLRVTDWDLCVPAELIQQYYSSLIRSHGGYRQSSKPSQSPFTTFPLEGDGNEKKVEEETQMEDGEQAIPEKGDTDPVKQLEVEEGRTGMNETAVQARLAPVLKGDTTGMIPEKRNALISALLQDMDDGEGDKVGFYTVWSHQTLSLAMETLKTLSRSATGTDLLTSLDSLKILFRQARILPTQATTTDYDMDKTSSSETREIRPDNKVEKEALSTIANTIFLHQPSTLRSLRELNAGHLIVERIKLDQRSRRDGEGLGSKGNTTEPLDEMMMFLLGRLLMWMTASKESGFLETLVEKDDLVQVLKIELSRPYVPLSKMAFEEMLKTTFHALAVYPSGDESRWEHLFSSLLTPLLKLFETIPGDTLTPPITHIINCLTRFPFTESLSPIWLEFPDNLSRLLNIVNGHLDRVLPASPWEPGEPIPRNHVGEQRKELERLDEVLTPSMLLLARLTKDNDVMRQEVKRIILPHDLDRSPGSIPLEKRRTLLGHLIRFLKAPNYLHLSTSIGETLWNVCDQDAGKLSNEIGYGNAAGLLFSKGITGPSQSSSSSGPSGSGSGSATIEEIPDPEPVFDTRHPITALDQASSSSPMTPELPEMTPLEKEREADRLMHLFSRMERNPALRMMENPMRGMVDSGRMEGWEREEGERERRRLEEEERRDEEEGMRELGEWKKRKKRG